MNYIVNSLVKKGLIKVERFKNSRNKLAYMYILTPKGMTEKMKLTHKFLKKKMQDTMHSKEKSRNLKGMFPDSAKRQTR